MQQVIADSLYIYSWFQGVDFGRMAWVRRIYFLFLLSWLMMCDANGLFVRRGWLID